ncbi:ArsR family transcriptional regulator [Romboutsia weinsteinii]|uniref:ArsR family transcriptional regulator n=1 Tax=Romboutsia weinsteinii TaxID=2020949 RepID=A0A371J026_9FIRM|nr:helix-turn-helix domain-containing protein [Romboutsia weinsteinii]RDY26063.1 ArsR family transcriptional regulator [Romboutsia weinsteinii]
MKEVLVLRDLECIKAIAHPRRIDILKTFNKEPLSAKQLSQLLDEPHAKINYHIKTLYKVGILELVEEKIKSGIVEKYYYPRAKNIVIGKTILDFSLDTDEEKKELCISKFSDLSEVFYRAAEEDILESNNVIDYHNISLTHNEINELNEVMKLKLEEILNNREYRIDDSKYDIAVVAIPLLNSLSGDEESVNKTECNV